MVTRESQAIIEKFGPNSPWSTLIRIEEKDDIWIWGSGFAKIQGQTTESVAELEQSGFEPLHGDPSKHLQQCFILQSQFRPFKQIGDERDLDGCSYFVSPQDIEKLEHCPVLLTSVLTRPRDERLFTSTRIYPPTEYGTSGIVMNTEDWYYYKISDLPKEAQERQIHISQRLDELEAKDKVITLSEHISVHLFNKDMEVKAMIQQLAQDYYQYHSQQNQESQQKRPLTINPFQNGDTFSLACQPVQGTIYAIQGAASGKKGWEQKKGMGPQFKHKSNVGTTDIEYNPTDRTTELDSTLTTSLWKEIEQFNGRDVDTVLITLAYLAASKEPSVWIFASDILNHRGIIPIMKKDTPDGKERAAGHRKEDIEDYAKSLSRISSIWVTIRQMIQDEDTDPKTRKRKRKQYTHTGRFLSIDEVWYQKEFNVDTGEYETRQPIGWKIRGGDWLRTFLEFPNIQVASLCQAILKYDPKNEMWEKWLGCYFFFHGHFSRPQGGSTMLNRTIKDMLTVNNLEIDMRNPQRARGRFEKAMNKLVTDSVIDGWKYKEEINLPSKRWLDIWLNQIVSIDITTKKIIA